MVDHDENREREVQLLVREILETGTEFDDDPNGPYSWACPFCCAKKEGGRLMWLKGVRMEELEHEQSCAYLIAKGLETKECDNDK